MYGVVDDNSNSYRDLIMYAMRINQGYADQCSTINEEPNADAIKFFLFFKRFWLTIME
jgi:hypothetical protein